MTASSSSSPENTNLVLLIDNYDSFTYNLYQYLMELGAQVVVKRHDEIDIDGIYKLAPNRILISPGPGYPKDAGISCDVIREFGPQLPIVGVCLGLQCMFQVYGGTVGHAGEIVHGKQSLVDHDGKGLFANLDLPTPTTPFGAARYHSLVGLYDTVPADLQITSTLHNQPQTIMGVRHRQYKVEGVQFHPESILTDLGKQMLKNFLDM